MIAKGIEFGPEVKLLLVGALDFRFGFNESRARLTHNLLLRPDTAIDLPQGRVALVDLFQRPVDNSDAIQQGCDVDLLPLDIAQSVTSKGTIAALLTVLPQVANLAIAFV